MTVTFSGQNFEPSPRNARNVGFVSLFGVLEKESVSSNFSFQGDFRVGCCISYVHSISIYKFAGALPKYLLWGLHVKIL